MSGLDLIHKYGVLWFSLSGDVVKRSGLRNGKLVNLLSDKFNEGCNNNNCSFIPLDEFNFHACNFFSNRGCFFSQRFSYRQDLYFQLNDIIL